MGFMGSKIKYIYRKYIDLQRKFKLLTRGLVRGGISGGLGGKHF